MSDNQNESNFSLSYNFTSKEIGILAKFLRSRQNELPEGIENFTKALEDAVYNSLTIEEVLKFYS